MPRLVYHDICAMLLLLLLCGAPGLLLRGRLVAAGSAWLSIVHVHVVVSALFALLLFVVF